MKIEEIAKKFNIPDDLWFAGDEVLCAYIFVEKHCWLFFHDSGMVVYQEGSESTLLNEEKEVERILTQSKRCNKILRQKKLERFK